MITLKLLKACPHVITPLSEIWKNELGNRWLPNVSAAHVAQKLQTHLNEDSLPLTWVAFENDTPIGMCSLRHNDGIWPNVSPWLGSLVVSASHQKRGVGKALIQLVEKKATELGFRKLYLFAFDPKIPLFYQGLGWNIMGADSFNNHPVTVMERTL